ncbi:biosynthetic-type acetolactate synthase large subunit [Streptomyces sp. NPDC006368]|uniref:biosynthetic-type acetolactate synthase large subunit n=1 Tax=Streptomyces sp. NPDC006368 TaxID=3156760 RepID=UPI0033AF97B8
MPEDRTGARILLRSLRLQGVESLFTTPRGAGLVLTGQRDPGRAAAAESDAGAGSGDAIRFVTLPHGQDAGHAAAGYASATGRVGVCVASPGAGAVELVTALFDAHMDSVPLVAVAFDWQVDTCGIAMPITKHTIHVSDVRRLPTAVAQAFHLASHGRPGPVLLDIETEVLRARSAEPGNPEHIDIPGFQPTLAPERRALREAAALLARSQRPVLYVGGGVLKADAAAELRTFAELTGAPVVTTLMARGVFPDSHPQHFGMPGMHGSVAAVAALQKADLVMGLGVRFDDRVTGDPATFAPHARVVHADIDPAEIGKNRRVDVGIVGDARRVLSGLIDAVREGRRTGRPQSPGHRPWLSTLERWRDTYPVGYRAPDNGSLVPQQVIERIGRTVGPDAVYVAGVGQHQMWAGQFIRYEKPRSFLNSGGAGTMGYAVPAAIGAATGRPGTPVWVIDGDGCFQMTGRSLVACAAARMPVKVAVINNSSLGMVRQLQSLYYGEREFGTEAGARGVPDYAALAEGYGCLGIRCDRADELDATIQKAMEVNDRPVVVDFVVEREEMVWPMVPPGASNDEIRIARDMAPDWDLTD